MFNNVSWNKALRKGTLNKFEIKSHNLNLLPSVTEFVTRGKEVVGAHMHNQMSLCTEHGVSCRNIVHWQ